MCSNAGKTRNMLLKQLMSFLGSVVLLTSLFTVQTSVTNLQWLASIGMPVDRAVVSSTILADWVGMNIRGEVPLVGLLCVALLLAFLTTRVITIWLVVKNRYIYALAGATAIAALVFTIPMALANMELIAGARSLVGKFFLIAAGGAAGYMFGSQLGRIPK